MISIDSFLPRVMPYVIGCSEPLARQAILDSAISFCDSSSILRQKIDKFSTVSGLESYDLETPNNQMRVSRVLSVTVDGAEIAGIFEEDVPSYRELSAKPSGFYTSRTDSELVLNFYPRPDAAYEVVVTASYAPTRSATTVENDLFNYWSDAITSSAISKLAGMPNMPFTNELLSANMAVTASKQSAQAKVESYYGRIRGGTRIKNRPLVR
mgnify:CR=1 FL=1|jgi:hypothetical protein